MKSNQIIRRKKPHLYSRFFLSTSYSPQIYDHRFYFLRKALIMSFTIVFFIEKRDYT